MKKRTILIAIIILGTLSFLKAQDEDKVKCGFTSSLHYVYNIKSGKIDLKSKRKNCLTNYDAKGNKIKESYYNQNGSIGNTYSKDVDKRTFKYDSKGKIIEEVVYSGDGPRISVKNIYVYDEKGNKIETNLYWGDGRFNQKIKFNYDEKGRNIETLWASNQKKTCKYDDKGNMIETMTNANGSFSYKYKYKYDTKGNYIELVECNVDGSIIIKHTYKYDSCGNVIEKVDYDKLNKLTYKEDIIYLK